MLSGWQRHRRPIAACDADRLRVFIADDPGAMVLINSILCGAEWIHARLRRWSRKGEGRASAPLQASPGSWRPMTCTPCDTAGAMELAWAGCGDDEIISYSGRSTKAMVWQDALEARQTMRARQARAKRS